MKAKRIDRNFALNIMNRLTFFESFSPTEKKSLAQFHRHFAIYASGEIVIEEGAHDDSLFILLSGTAIVTKRRSAKPIATIQPGDFFGEIAFLTKGPRTATITAEGELIVIRVDDLMLEQLAPVTREKFKDNIIRCLIERLRYMEDMVMNVSA